MGLTARLPGHASSTTAASSTKIGASWDSSVVQKAKRRGQGRIRDFRGGDRKFGGGRRYHVAVSRSLLAGWLIASACLLPRQAEARKRVRVENPNYHLTLKLPSLRIGLGPSFTASPMRSAGFGFQLHAGGQFAFQDVRRHPALFLAPEFGYMFDGANPRHHSAAFGLGLGVGNPRVRFMLRPRFLLGRLDRKTAVGLNTGAALEFMMGGIGLELAHQVSYADSIVRQGVQVMVTLDFVPLALVGVRRWWQKED